MIGVDISQAVNYSLEAAADVFAASAAGISLYVLHQLRRGGYRQTHFHNGATKSDHVRTKPHQGQKRFGSGAALLPDPDADWPVHERLGQHYQLYSALPQLQQRSVYWTLRLSEALYEVQPWRQVPGFQFLTIGFLDPELETDGFGVILYASPDVHAERPSIANIAAGDHTFPIVVRSVVRAAHATTVNPVEGTTACWARSRVGSSPRGPGLLTAKHVVTGTLGACVSLTDGSTGSVLDLAPEPIDAALVGVPGTPPALHHVGVYPLPAQERLVQFTGASSGFHETPITQVSMFLGVRRLPEFPNRFAILEAGLPGDSGALITDVETGRPVGIYQGEVTDSFDQTVGLAQGLEQVRLLMDLEVYE